MRTLNVINVTCYFKNRRDEEILLISPEDALLPPTMKAMAAETQIKNRTVIFFRPYRKTIKEAATWVGGS